LLKLAGLELELEKLLGVQVDVVLANSLHHRIRNRVMAEARPL
jgi:predicted nucleotidyltransferase